jgi:hypothetical protein
MTLSISGGSCRKSMQSLPHVGVVIECGGGGGGGGSGGVVLYFLERIRAARFCSLDFLRDQLGTSEIYLLCQKD